MALANSGARQSSPPVPAAEQGKPEVPEQASPAKG
jgi:hypothetical protein